MFAATSMIIAACGADDEPAAEEPSTDDTTEPAAEEPPAADPAGDEPDGEPIKIGVLTSLTANSAPWGLQYQDGAALAVAEINAAGGVDGRPLELVVADDENDAEQGVAGFEELVEEGVVGTGGVISSTVGLAFSPLAEELQIPTFTLMSGAAGARRRTASHQTLGREVTRQTTQVHRQGRPSQRVALHVVGASRLR